MENEGNSSGESVSDCLLKISNVSNVCVKQMHFVKAGDNMMGHAHTYDHVTLLGHGSVRVTVEGVSKEFKAPQILVITKDKQHDLVALEDDTVCYCIHGIRDGNGVEDIIDPDSYTDAEKFNLIASYPFTKD